MAACQLLWFDPTQVGCVPTDPFGEQAGPPADGFRPCPKQGRGFLDPAGRWRHACPTHQRQLAALDHTGQAGRIRWAAQPTT